MRQAEKFLTSDKLPAKKTQVVSGEVRLLEREVEGKVMTLAVNAGESPAVIQLSNGTQITLPRLGVQVVYH